MKDGFYRSPDDLTSRNLDAENRRLKAELQKLREEASKTAQILAFHDKLERDFFSSESLEDLIIRLLNCLHLMPDVDFVSVCLTRQYLKSMLGSRKYEQLLSKLGASTKMRYLSIREEEEVRQHLPASGEMLFEKTPAGSHDIFFPDHGDEVRGHAIVPLLVRHRLIGTLNVGSIRSRHFYTAEMGPDFLGRLSAKFSLAIDAILAHGKLAIQSEVLEQDIARAAFLQKSLLPSSPMRTDNLEILAFFHPCQKLGGDFYDFMAITPERSAIVIADVAGHGISAALIAAMLKFSLQIDDIETFSPVEIISSINRKFCHILSHGDYITLCLALIDTKRMRMNLVRAGHPHPLLCRTPANNTLINLSPHGPPLGVEPDSFYDSMEIDLKPGDVILFYTDGLTDALAEAGQPSDLAHFLSHLMKHPQEAPLAERILAEVSSLALGKEAEDDVSLLVVALHPSQETFL